jgi:pSer/pThr/pTyr-binding forkhead associated (FHA) protein
MKMPDSPLASHAATPRELQERHRAEQDGHPFLLLLDNQGRQILHVLDGEQTRLSIGRNPANDLALEWDPGVSRLHTALERIGGEWTIGDDGLSRNGSWVNEERVRGRRRLNDGDVIRLGATAVIFRHPDAADESPTLTGPVPVPAFSPGQRRVLVELCRPYQDAQLAAPATNRQIADRLSVSVDAVKSQLRGLFIAFGVDDLPQNQKRSVLATRALKAGVVSAQDFLD